jgi:predicted AAA+ superfamily ATPase
MSKPKFKEFVIYRKRTTDGKLMPFYRFKYYDIESITDTEEGCKVLFKNGDWFVTEGTAAEYKEKIGWEATE